MKIISKSFCLLLVLNSVPYFMPSSLAANTVKKPAQDKVEKKSKLKLTKRSKASNPYSISKPYNPDNPPPINDKVSPVSSNAH